MVKMIAALLILMASSLVYGQQNVRIIGDSTGSPIGNSGSALSVSLQGSTVAVVSTPLSPIQSTVNCTGTSSVAKAANANRRLIEIRALKANTDDVYMGWGVTATTSGFPIEPSDTYWIETSTVAVNCISASGTQVLRVTEWSR
jgi:hypothetical protein